MYKYLIIAIASLTILQAGIGDSRLSLLGEAHVGLFRPAAPNFTKIYGSDDKLLPVLVFGVGYGDDLKKVRKVIEDVLEKDGRVLQDPPTTIGVVELGDSSVNFAVRPWVKTSDYWGFYFDTTEKIKLRFDEEGINIPYPQRDVHMHTA